jgi:hypothetical protein
MEVNKIQYIISLEDGKFGAPETKYYNRIKIEQK